MCPSVDGPCVFWLQDPTFLYVAAGAAVFSVTATERTQAMGFAPGTAVAMGVLTGIGGGVPCH